MNLRPEITKHYLAMRELPDGRICGVAKLLFHYTMHVDIYEYGYVERYCYDTAENAIKAMNEWTGNGDPDGWHKHPETGRRRDPKTGVIWNEREYHA